MADKPTRVRVIRGFCVEGRRREPGAVVLVPLHTAIDLVCFGRAEAVDPLPRPFAKKVGFAELGAEVRRQLTRIAWRES